MKASLLLPEDPLPSEAESLWAAEGAHPGLRRPCFSGCAAPCGPSTPASLCLSCPGLLASGPAPLLPHPPAGPLPCRAPCRVCCWGRGRTEHRRPGWNKCCASGRRSPCWRPCWRAAGGAGSMGVPCLPCLHSSEHWGGGLAGGGRLNSGLPVLFLCCRPWRAACPSAAPAAAWAAASPIEETRPGSLSFSQKCWFQPVGAACGHRCLGEGGGLGRPWERGTRPLG